jgi:hypothetical protein
VQQISILEVALRVLTAISLERTDPDPPDVEELRKLTPGRPANESIEDLACAVVKEAMSRTKAGW